MTQKVSSQVLIDLPIEQAWDRLRDLSLPHNYVPGIVKTEIVSEQSEGVGASRYVYRSRKNYIQETVEEWHEGTGFVIRLHRVDKPAPPFRSASFRYELTGKASGETLFTASMEYELPWGPVGKWLEKKLKPIVANIIADVAMSMKLYYETGAATTPAALKSYKVSLRTGEPNRG